MEKKEFVGINEPLYIEKLDNGIDVYLYNTNKTKNFYISICVKYGANVTKYKLNNKTTEVIAGSAHFLEHKVMALSENKEISKRINELGSLANAWTNYQGTNYNIFGSERIIDNLILLLDIFYNTNINEKCVNEEKGIIGEEIDMYKDQINYYMTNQLFNNLFHNSYVKNTVVGERSDIDKITAASLNKIYNDFYIPNNTFIIICGSFDNEEILNVLKEYMNKLNLKKKEIPKRIIEKEKDEVAVTYQEIQKDIEHERVKYAIKIPKSVFDIKNTTILKYYLSIILSANFSMSSKKYEEYKNKNIIIDMGSNVYDVDDYIVIVISSFCKKSQVFLDAIFEDIKNIKLNKIEFERKKKIFLKSFITAFDNIEDVEYNICDFILNDGKINFNEYDDIKEMDYNTACKVLKKISYNNFSVIKTIK